MSQAPNIANAMNLGGGVAGPSKSAKLLSGMREELTKLQPIMDKIVASTQKMAENLTKAKGASSLGFAGANGQATSLGFIEEGPASGMSFKSFARGLASAAAVGLTAAGQLYDPAQFAESSLTRARFGFFSGQGASGASMTFQGMMNRGTGMDPLDAARAAMAGTSMGLMPSLPGYNTVAQGAATFSNLVPGAGLEGGMGAMAALNQASSVNRLRMIGIQVRDPATGTMRSPDSIANDLWNKINTQKTGNSPITKRDLAISLQSGNSLDMMLNQYFGNDPVLRQGIVTALMQKASGGDLSKSSLIQTNALPELAVSTGERNAASYSAIDANTSAVEKGMIEANNLIIDAAYILRDSAGTFSGAVEVFAAASQLLGAGNGATSTITGGLLSGATQGVTTGATLLGGKMLLDKLFSGGKGAQTAAQTAAKTAGQTALKTAGKAIPLVGPALSAVDAATVEKEDYWASFTRDMALTAGVSLAAAAPTGGWSLLAIPAAAAVHLGTGALTGKLGEGDGADSTGNAPTRYNPLEALAAGLGSFGGGAGPLVGEGDGGGKPTGNTPTRYNPLESLAVNAEWRKHRPYLIDGKKPANEYHTGVDYKAEENTQVFSVKEGVVYRTVFSDRGFGKHVYVKHPDGYTSLYGHLNAIGVQPGDTVKAGQPIGLSGNTGLSSGPHLHFEVREKADDQGTNVDPVAYIAGSSKPARAADFDSESATSGETSGEASASTAGLLGELTSGISLLPGLTGAPSPNGEGDGGGSSSTTNYGGVSVQINVPKGSAINEHVLAKEIKRVLADEAMLKKAVTR